MWRLGGSDAPRRTITAIKEALALPEQGSLSNGFWVVEVVDTVVNAWPLSQEALLKIALGTEDVSLIPHKPEQPVQCWCTTCRPITLNDMRFVVCPDCGNKRCPKAHNHTLACTNSNEPGQASSSWENVTPMAQPEPECPDCKAKVLYECVACSSNNYPQHFGGKL